MWQKYEPKTKWLLHYFPQNLFFCVMRSRSGFWEESSSLSSATRGKKPNYWRVDPDLALVTQTWAIWAAWGSVPLPAGQEALEMILRTQWERRTLGSISCGGPQVKQTLNPGWLIRPLKESGPSSLGSVREGVCPESPSFWFCARFQCCTRGIREAWR